MSVRPLYLIFVRLCGWLVLLDHGQIAETGTHQELLLPGIYARLWQHQSGGFLNDNTTTTMLAEAPRLSA